MSVLDSSAAFEYLTGRGEREVGAILERRGAIPPAAPSILVTEIVSALRNAERRGEISARRAGAAVSDLGALPVSLFPTMRLRKRAWELRQNFTAADGMFAALAEQLDEPLITSDQRLAQAARSILGLDVIEIRIG